MAKQIENTKPFTVVDTTPAKLFQTELTFSGHPASYYLDDPEAHAVQEYFSKRVSSETNRQGTIAHLELSSDKATKFQYTTKHTGDKIHTAIIAETIKAFPSIPINDIPYRFTLIDHGKTSKADIGGTSRFSDEGNHYNFIIIGKDPLHSSTPNGLFFWIHPDTAIIPNSITHIPITQINLDTNTPIPEPAPALTMQPLSIPEAFPQPPKPTSKNKISDVDDATINYYPETGEYLDADGFNFTPLFKDMDQKKDK